ncbi:MAG: hypothetical protein COW00_12565 [Bdellovibrio sp. CG12_big_fil_rev_8_21_14_0_65_39_13]|nr:MAG: hypothetical protein COW78_06855 [Bdellovibrio sp. CG22_combo_CG10-13_8_21_14_all_39_27]PIQ59018.1 MAG: hypothetical protein COW00_12565 [Bdellovibrio sp. CG12_big_fil_rev_8_21_14_0_65_39_13]PIR32994.1 MAG: hypothetical protein COV37_18025 [Bdellovibrio sp. CG11_big_fil_rev_8_21_14_0_20_39_38]
MDLKSKFCPKPFQYLEIGSKRDDGRMPCFACCPQLVEEEVGDFSKESVEQIWNSQSFQNIRSGILDGSYRFCKIEDCPEIQSGSLPDKLIIEDPVMWDIIKNKKTKLDYGPKILNLNYDQTCNLACPSCRTDYISHNNNPSERETIDRAGEKIKKEALSNASEIIFCSSGDPFSSQHFRSFLSEIDFNTYKNLKIQIVSNGVMLTEKTWEQLKNIHGHVGLVCISLDAGSEATYGITRVGGNWKILMQNIKFLGQLRAKGEIERLRLDFVVQDYNYQEMPRLVDIGHDAGADEVFFQKIVNWNTYSPAEFKKRLVYLPDHPEHQQFLQVLKDERLKDKIVNPGNLGDMIPKNYQPRPFNLKNAIRHTLIKRIRKFQLFLRG